MPSLSQFNPPLKLSGGGKSTTGEAQDVIQVGGPLRLDAEHVLPVTIHFTLVQSKKDVHDPAKAKYAYGTAVIKARAKTWSEDLMVKPGFFQPGEARAIAVAVVPRKKQFLYETLTWCEHVELH